MTTSHTNGNSLALGNFPFSWNSAGGELSSIRLSRLARALFILPARSTNMTTLVSPLFWNMKIKIAILTLATFAALC